MRKCLLLGLPRLVEAVIVDVKQLLAAFILLCLESKTSIDPDRLRLILQFLHMNCGVVSACWRGFTKKTKHQGSNRTRLGKADTKTGAAHVVPLSPEAQSLIERMRPLTFNPDHDKTIFDLAVASVTTQFARGRSNQGIEDLHFHDFRAHALTRLAQTMNGLELLKISGHADLNQLQCYYRTTPQQIAMKMG